MKKIKMIDGNSTGEYYPAEEVDAELAQLKAELDALRSVREKAESLLSKMNSTYNSGEYLAVWQIASIHRGQYSGENWIVEQAELEAALHAAHDQDMEV